MERPGKAIAVRFLTEAIEGYLARTQTTRAALAELCGISEGYFSKRASGQQGDLIEFVFALPLDTGIRAEFFHRLHEAEASDPIVLSVEQLVAASVRFLRLAGTRSRGQS